MSSKVIVSAAAIVAIFSITPSPAFKYGIKLRDESIFRPCNFKNVKYIDEYLDMSNMTFEYLMNGSVYAYGDIVVIRDLGTQDNPIMIESFKKSRGNWIETIYNIRRFDGCKSLFAGVEVISEYLKDIPEENKRCPFVKGSKFHFNSVFDTIIELNDPLLAGEFKSQIVVQITELNEAFCANILAEIYGI